MKHILLIVAVTLPIAACSKEQPNITVAFCEVF